jgi:hypothetical protein
MAILIDGYNLLHASGILPSGVGPGTLERARNALLNFLVESLEADELKRTVVVFDAREAPKGRPRLVTHRGLQVHFAPNPGDADALIEQLILEDHSPRKLVVVSSDHRLQRAAKRRRAQAVDSDRWEIFHRRIGRGGKAAEEPAKPAGPLSEYEVARWLSRFGMTPSEGETVEQAIAEQIVSEQMASELANKRDEPEVEDPRSGVKPPKRPKRKAKPNIPNEKRLGPGGSAINPFPPGYGEDLLKDD